MDTPIEFSYLSVDRSGMKAYTSEGSSTPSATAPSTMAGASYSPDTSGVRSSSGSASKATVMAEELRPKV